MDNIKTVLITGATSGIGKAAAEIYAENGHRVVITGRRADRLLAIKNELKTSYKVDVLSIEFDVRNPNEVKTKLNELPPEWQNIDVLINNAGLAVGTSTIDEGNLDDWDRMIDTNVKGLLYMTRATIPFLKQSDNAHIVNISSVAGKETYKNGNVYCATKHAVQALSDAMRIDLLEHKIKVTSICPGAAETEFSIVRYKGDEAAAKNVYKGFDPLVAKDIAETIYFATSRPKHVSISDLLIMPAAQANTSHLLRK